MALTADVVMTNGKFVTADERFSVASAVAIYRGRIVAIGDNDAVRSMAGAATRSIDLKGQCVVPGQIDSFQHYITSGLDMVQGRGTVNIIELRSIEEILRRIKQRVDATPKGEWVETGCMFRGALKDGRWPNRWDLDQIAPDHPVYIRQGGRAIIANSQALRLAGIQKDTPNPTEAPGVIVRDERSEATGQLVAGAADMAREVWSRLTGKPSWEWDFHHFGRDVLIDALLAQQRVNLACGITAARDDATYPVEVGAWAEARRRGLLKNRVGLLLAVPERHLWKKEERDRYFNSFFEPWELGDEWLWIAGVSSGYNLEGYQQIDEAGMRDIVRECVRRDWTLAIAPSIGITQSVDEVLTALEEVAEQIPSGRRHIMTHPNELRRPADIERARKLNLTISPTPLLYYYAAERSFRMHTSIQAARLHSDTAADAWTQTVTMWGPRIKDWLEAGLVVSCGSVVPAASLDIERPFLGQYCALTSETLAGVLLPDQAITREQMVRLYTSHAAVALGKEREIGSLEVGKRADMAVLDRDILACPNAEIKEIKVLQTYVDGELVYERERGG